MVLLAFLAGVLDAVAALLVFAVLGLVTAPDATLDIPLLGDLRERFPTSDAHDLLVGAAAVISAVVVVRALVYVTQIYVQNRIIHNMASRLSGTLVGGYLDMPWSVHLRRNSAELIRNSFLSVQEVSTGVLAPLTVLTSEALLILSLVTVLAVTSPVATLAAIAVLGVVVGVVLPLTQPRLASLGERYQHQLSVSQQALQESFNGLRDIRVLGREGWFRWEFERSRGELARAQYARATLAELPRIVLELLMVLFVLGFVVIAADRGDEGDAIAVIGMFGYAAMRLLPSVNKIVVNLGYLRFSGAAVDVVARELDLVRSLPPRAPEPPPLPFEREIRLRGVTFRYETGHDDAVRDLDLVIPKGSSLGIVGPTGGGKTTMVDILLGLLQPTHGQVTVDGVDVRGNERAWQQRIGVVPQSTFMADDSLRRNVALGTDDEEIDDERLRHALELAQLATFVSSLPDGADTVIGEHGTRLSGGQRQRLAIARALYREPDVLIFDEGTSALDPVTEAELVEALDALRTRHTVIAVAHRLTTVKGSDQIVVLRGGAIAARGTFEELLASDEGFRRMAGAPDLTTIAGSPREEEAER